MTSQTTPDALSDIVARIESARKAALKPAANITLIAVSKTHDAARIRPLLAAGQRVFGENRVQEAQAKWPKLREEFADIQLHLIGPLQTNKVKDAVALFDVIHTLDRPKLAGALKKEFAAAGKTCPLFVQVNTGEEEQKAGITPSDAKDFVVYAKNELGLPVIGLMCIPPVDDEPSPHFAFLRKLAGECGLEHLSMGMSADFETAIRFGASHVRVGSALFGARS